MSEVVGLEILNLEEVVDGGIYKDKICYISDYSVIPYGSEGKERLQGTITHKGKTKVIKSFDKVIVDFFKSNELLGAIVKLKVKGGVYNNKLELTVQEVSLDVGNYTLSHFLKSVDVPKVFNEFKSFLNQELSQNYYTAITKVLNNTTISNFMTAFAGSKMHDAQVGGLMWHTLKMMKIARLLVESDSRLEPYKDILYAGLVFHDVGKIYEMSQGVYTKNSFVTHRTIGIEMLAEHKGDISALIGETNYYHILAIIQGHHGEYGDKPKTVWAYISHLIDMLDSQTTGIMDKIEAGEVSTNTAGNNTLYVDGRALVL